MLLKILWKGSDNLKELDLYVVNRSDGVVKGSSECFSYEINRDYLTNEKSKFTPLNALTASEGDFLIVKSHDLSEINPTGITPMFFGVVESFENKEIVACDLYNIANFEIAATKKSGTSYGQHIQNLLNIYLDSSKLVSRINRTVDATSAVAFSYQPKDPPTTVKFIDYLVDGFKKYGVVWAVSNVRYGSDNNLVIDTVIKKVTDTINLKNNSETFINWEVYGNNAGRDQENRLLIISKATTNSESPTVLSTWYLKTDGTLTQSQNDGVFLPTKDAVEIFDTAQTNPPTYREVAQSNLGGKTFSHEINFDLLKTSNLVSFSELEIGMSAVIVYDGVIHNSVLTGFTMSSGDEFIHLRFGHVRSTLTQVLKR